METGTSQEQAQATDYSFLEFEAIEKLRSEQLAQLKSAGDAAVSELSYIDAFDNGATVRTTVEKKLTPELDEKLEAYLETILSKEADSKRFFEIFTFLRSISAQNMDSAKWYNGDRGVDGTYDDYTTSGRYQADIVFEALSSEEPTASEPESPEDTEDPELPDDFHTSPEAMAVYGAVTTARNNLAQISVARRQQLRKGGKQAEQLSAKYDLAKTAYDTALKNVTDFYVTGYRTSGFTDEVIMERVLPRMIGEHHSFTEAEYNLLKTDDSLRARAARFLGKRGAMFGLSAASGAGIGFAARAISKSAVVAGVGISGGAVAGGLIAARFTKNILLAKVRNNVALNKEFDNRRAKDELELQDHISETTDSPLEQSLQSANEKISDVISGRVEKDVKSNRRRVAFSALIGGIAAAAVEFGPDIYHSIAGNEHYSPTTSTPDHIVPTTPQTPSTPAGPTASGGTPSGSGAEYTVSRGEGYGQVFKDLAGQQGAHNVDGYREFLKFTHDHASEKIFTDNNSVPHSGGAWIGRPGLSHYNARFLADFHQQLVEEGKIAA